MKNRKPPLARRPARGPQAQFRKKTAEKEDKKLPAKWGTEFYEKFHSHEIDMREKIHGRLPTSSTIFISVLGAILFMLRGYVNHGMNIGAYLFWFFFGISSVVVLSAGWYLTRAWWNNRYELMPTAKELYKYRKELETFYDGYDVEVVDNAFSDYLIENYYEAASINATVNKLRTDRLF